MTKLPLKMSADGWGGLDYPWADERGYFYLWKSAGLEVKAKAMLGSYQGDIVALLYDPQTDLWAYGHTGYGSCSGCDAFEACNTLEDYEDLRDRLVDGLIWHDKARALQFFLEHDWQGEYFGNTEPEFLSWYADSVALLRG